MAVNYGGVNGGSVWPWGYHHATGTTVSTIQAAVWANWTAQTTTSSAITTNYGPTWANVWTSWNLQGIVHQSQRNVRYPAYTSPPPPTPEQIAAREAAVKRDFEIREQRRKRMLAAEDRARALLLDHLDDKQKRDYEEKQAFDVEVAGKTYRVGQGTHGNVREIVMIGDKEIVVRRFCIPSRISSMPEADVHLSQKLMLEDAIEEFEQIANISVYRQDLLRPDPRLEQELAQIR
jgi:hypothetical protein